MLILDGYRELITYDLVSRGGTGNDECWGDQNSATGKGWGAGYENNCIHSGTIRTSGDLPTTYYNYTLATADTIIDDNTSQDKPTTNTTEATESICPKGWTLPTNTQINSNRNTASFSPVSGGGYRNGVFYSESVFGLWWGSEARNDSYRYVLEYNSSTMYINSGTRYSGHYIRCVPAP